MTVTLLDAPGPLGDRYASVRFTATSPVLTVAVEFNPGENGPRECAYDGTDESGQGGSFAHLYRLSTRDGNAFELKREGGWPAPFQLRVKESPYIPPPVTTFWSVLYERDLRTLPSQTLRASTGAGFESFAFDEQPWFIHAADAAGALTLVNGSGIRVSAASDCSAGNPYAGTSVGLRAYAMTGYDPAKLTACQVRFGGTMAGRFGAVAWSGTETWGYGPGSNHSQIVYIPASQAVRARYGSDVALSQVSVPDLAPTDVPGEWAFGVGVGPYDFAARGLPFRNTRSHYYQRGIAASGFPPLESMEPFATTLATAFGASHDANLKVGAYVGSTSGTLTFTLTHIRIMQKALPTL